VVTAPHRQSSLFVCPQTGETLDNWRTSAGIRYPLIAGIPVLVPEPRAFLLRHGPWEPGLGVPTGVREPLGVDEPDAVTPHLPAGALGAPPGLGDWLNGLAGLTPAQVTAGMGAETAPPGPVLHLGCGVGDFARRAVLLGRVVYAVDKSPEAVVMARDLLTGRQRQTWLPTHKGGCVKVRFPHPPLVGGVQFAIAESTRLPFRPGTFAWVHLDRALDNAPTSRFGELLVSATSALRRGGVLTLSTAYGGPAVAVPDARAPEAELRDALEELELHVLREQDQVPRIVRHYDRGFDVSFHHCLVARRG
jgi:SAM-dependent methyltransferase